MTQKEYEEMRKRITVVDRSTLDAEDLEYMGIVNKPECIVYRCDCEGLAMDDLSPYIIHPIATKNMWNVCERFHMLLGHPEFK